MDMDREAVTKRQTDALELRLAGATYDQIAKALGYAALSSAYDAVQAALAARTPPGEEPTTLTELARLDALLTGLWAKARRGDYAAVDRVLRIEERREHVLAREAGIKAAAEPEPERTGLSEFERRLRAREQAAEAARSASP